MDGQALLQSTTLLNGKTEDCNNEFRKFLSRFASLDNAQQQKIIRGASLDEILFHAISVSKHRSVEIEIKDGKSSISNSVLSDEKEYSFTVRHQNLHNLYEKQVRHFWHAGEINVIDDRAQFENLPEEERRFVTHLLAFSSQIDGIICENINSNFAEEWAFIPDATNFYTIQNAIELIHNQTYSFLIDTCIRDPDEKRKAKDAIQYYPEIRNIAKWISTWMDRSVPLGERLIAFCCIEGILFTGFFAGVLLMKRKNLLHGFTDANELIRRDEGIHTEFGMELFKTVRAYPSYIEKIGGLPSSQRILEIIRSSVEECAEPFVRKALQVELISASANDVMNYVKCSADNLVDSLDIGEKAVYGCKNPFPWMLTISVPNKSNFFETKVFEYMLPQLSSSGDSMDLFDRRRQF